MSHLLKRHPAYTLASLGPWTSSPQAAMPLPTMSACQSPIHLARYQRDTILSTKPSEALWTGSARHPSGLRWHWCSHRTSASAVSQLTESIYLPYQSLRAKERGWRPLTAGCLTHAARHHAQLNALQQHADWRSISNLTPEAMEGNSANTLANLKYARNSVR